LCLKGLRHDEYSSLHQWALTGRVYWVSLWFGEYRNGNPYNIRVVHDFREVETGQVSKNTLCVYSAHRG